MTILQELAKCVEDGTPLAQCTIVEVSGSTPRHAGSRILVYTPCHTFGTMGGGEKGKLVIAEALGSLKNRKLRLIPFRDHHASILIKFDGS